MVLLDRRKERGGTLEEVSPGASSVCTGVDPLHENDYDAPFWDPKGGHPLQPLSLSCENKEGELEQWGRVSEHLIGGFGFDRGRMGQT